ncbi:amino acid permease [Cyclobacterium jeungdonense]|uniref:Amino acid permease n=1 Tax=Cyclobacterium jeungdonense TaxID=708087 RepID=A0ABT8C6S3_9BACT|nr:amino acid permease [Cyclobacterium jeungdonense]MDN3687734.1 amino acid permease [Cyclobacterium jeungdonense]
MSEKRLRKTLRLFDVYAISTGAMFSSGFFLLPGLAAAMTGPSVVLAYLVAGAMMYPTMLSVAELATAMPRAGGAYYFIDRSLGPLFGTIGGIGSWFALIFKSAFALIGMGAYVSIFIDVPITPVAIGLTLTFGFTNIIGSKEAGWLQKVLVATLVIILTFYTVQGLAKVFQFDFFNHLREEYDVFFLDGTRGFFGSIGLVFVSYAGLTKVASVAEEVHNPDKNIPLAMFLSLATATIIYVVGVFIMVSLLDKEVFFSDLTPVATAGEVFMTWLPGKTGLILVVIAAIAAFASTANAGIMSAARYPLGMARDQLIPAYFGKLGKFQTPFYATLATTALMVFLLLVFNVESVAKIASTFQLLLFGLLNICVIVMRESELKGYDPGFRSPYYPWVQLTGLLFSVFLIIEMGFLSLIFTFLIIGASIFWYFSYAKDKVKREGAMFHVYSKLGQRRYDGLEMELWSMMKEKGLRAEDPYEKVISRALIMDTNADKVNYEQLLETVSSHFATKTGLRKKQLLKAFRDENEEGLIAIGKTTALKHIRFEEELESEVAIARFKEGLPVKFEFFELFKAKKRNWSKKLHAVLFLISSKKHSGQHLRMLAHLAEILDNENFPKRWLEAADESELRQILLRDERFINLLLETGKPSGVLIGKMIQDLKLPEKSLITVIKREGKIIFPHGNSVLKERDELSIIGEKQEIDEIRSLYEAATRTTNEKRSE